MELNRSCSKYLKEIKGSKDGKIDIYAVIETFGVTCPARQHALKKLLMPGVRGGKSCVDDLGEAADAIVRAIELEQSRKPVVGCTGAGEVHSEQMANFRRFPENSIGSLMGKVSG